jgi:2-isopropylmalate synthase
MKRKITIFDTTLRDGEQSPGAVMDTQAKLEIAAQLLRLKVDVIEAGFPASSPGDAQSVKEIAALVGDKAVVAALCRALNSDIKIAAEALKGAKRPRIHTGIGVSPQHLKYKLRLSEDEAIKKAVAAIKYAKKFVDDVQFFAEDAGRADCQFLAKICEAAIKAGASCINIPDTTGYSLPNDFESKIRYLMSNTRGIENVTLSVHCHNDLGLATALTLAGIRGGATQVECAINGLGERAGNAALEEVVMLIKLHEKELNAHTGVNTREITRASRLVSKITGIGVQANKAIVGANAFTHSSGIHQDGIIKNSSTYEVIDPLTVGAKDSAIMLTARSGRAAVRHKIKKLGYELSAKSFDKVYAAFLSLADKKQEIYDEDLEALVAEFDRGEYAIFKLVSLQVSCGFPLTPTATLKLADKDGVEHVACTYGTGPIDAAYKAVDQIVNAAVDLSEFEIKAITRGMDALGEVMVRVKAGGGRGGGRAARGDSGGARGGRGGRDGAARDDGGARARDDRDDRDGRIYTGRGADGDIIVSATKAYLNALNRLLASEMCK